MTAKVRPLLDPTHQHARVEAYQLEGDEKYHRGYEQGVRFASRWRLVSGLCIGFAVGALVAASVLWSAT